MSSLAELNDYLAAHDVEWADVQTDVTALGTPASDPTLPADFATAYANWKSQTAGMRTTLEVTEAEFSPFVLDVTPAGSNWDIATRAGGAITALANRVAVAGGSLANTGNLPQPTAPDWTLDAYDVLGDIPGVTPLADVLDPGSDVPPDDSPPWPAWARWALGGGVALGLAWTVDKGLEAYSLYKGK
jgi:hypothetical protein